MTNIYRRHGASTPPDLAATLPADVYWQLMYELCSGLPAPESDDAAALAVRDRAAIAEVACLLPAHAAEAKAAMLFVQANAWAAHALRGARQKGLELKQAMRCQAQAGSMMRHAQEQMRMLLRMQAVREKREADPRASDRAAWH